MRNSRGLWVFVAVAAAIGVGGCKSGCCPQLNLDKRNAPLQRLTVTNHTSGTIQEAGTNKGALTPQSSDPWSYTGPLPNINFVYVTMSGATPHTYKLPGAAALVVTIDVKLDPTPPARLTYDDASAVYVAPNP